MSKKKIQVYIKCQGCGRELNRTSELPSEELANKIFDDAVLNPMIGWCNACDRKPYPYIEVDGKIVRKMSGAELDK